MAIIDLPPSVRVSCDRCGENFAASEGYDYIVLDKAEMQTTLRSYGWEWRGEEIRCEDCLYEVGWAPHDESEASNQESRPDA